MGPYSALVEHWPALSTTFCSWEAEFTLCREVNKAREEEVEGKESEYKLYSKKPLRCFVWLTSRACRDQIQCTEYVQGYE